ncbi:hypothetical protein GEMRC1_007410 [Eukaryota sp. GEM-RC1]
MTIAIFLFALLATCAFASISGARVSNDACSMKLIDAKTDGYWENLPSLLQPGVSYISSTGQFAEAIYQFKNCRSSENVTMGWDTRTGLNMYCRPGCSVAFRFSSFLTYSFVKE